MNRITGSEKLTRTINGQQLFDKPIIPAHRLAYRRQAFVPLEKLANELRFDERDWAKKKY
jgi:hypothetical protein